MQRPHSTTRGAVAGALLLSLTLVPAVSVLAAPTQVKPGFNVFSAEQDVEIGRQSAVEAERQLPLLNDRNTAELRRIPVQRGWPRRRRGPSSPTRSAS